MGWSNTYRQCLDLDDPNDKCADAGGAPIDDDVVDNLDTLCPARIVSIVVVILLVVL